MSSDIIETIDNALSDWATSEDAMRWTPDPEPATEGLGWKTVGGPVPGLTPSDDATPRWVPVPGVQVFDPTALTHLPCVRFEWTTQFEWTTDLIVWPLERCGPHVEVDPRERALQLRRRRHTGPPAPRMDGRR